VEFHSRKSSRAGLLPHSWGSRRLLAGGRGSRSSSGAGLIGPWPVRESLPSVPFAHSDGVRIYYEAQGKGPALLLVPGIPAISSDWFPFADRLGERFRVVVYDNRGSGRSDAPPGPYSTRQLAVDAVAVLDALVIERAHLFGVSLGGMIAQELALGFPERVDRLVLGSTQASTQDAVRPRREVSNAFAFETDDWAERMRVLAPFAFAPGVEPQLLAKFIDKKSGDVEPDHGYRGQIAAVLAHDALDRLGARATHACDRGLARPDNPRREQRDPVRAHPPGAAGGDRRRGPPLLHRAARTDTRDARNVPARLGPSQSVQRRSHPCSFFSSFLANGAAALVAPRCA
jgi:3-oxoadipate enol-lactonase